MAPRYRLASVSIQGHQCPSNGFSARCSHDNKRLNMSSPSTPSDSSVLALHDFTYNGDIDYVNYPHDHDQSQPQSPASARAWGPISPVPRRSRARAYSLSSIDSSLLSSHIKQNGEHSTRGDEEYAVGFVGRKRPEDAHMDPFSKAELGVVLGSSLMVLVLILVAATLSLGKINL